MARKKAQANHGDCIARLVLYCTLVAAWCFVAANAQRNAYIVRFDPDAIGMSSIASEYMGIAAQNDAILDQVLGVAREDDTVKVYDYSESFRGVAMTMSPVQKEMMKRNPAILSIEPDILMYTQTTHSPEYMALPNAWNRVAGNHSAGEDIVIGVVDTGIYPDHPSFAATDGVKAYPPHPTFKGLCATDSRVPKGFCNGKIVGARQFFEGSKSAGTVDASDPDVNSPLDGNGHGTHCAGTAAGNSGVPVVVHGVDYGLASGAAPRARIAVYKVLNQNGTGRMSDIIMGIEQAIKDGVHVLSLSLGPSAAQVGNVTFTGNFELACLGAVQAGVVVVHAAGNTGPGTSTVNSWSPWIISVGATTMDRSYPNDLYTGDGRHFSGLGLAPPTMGATNYSFIRASDAAVAGSGSFLNLDFDCADASVLQKKLIQGKILVCTWSGVPSFEGKPATLGRVAAQAMGAVGVVLVTLEDYKETVSPANFNFEGFPGISIWGASEIESFLGYLNSTNGATGRIGGVNKAVYTGLPPSVAAFSSRGPDVYFGLEEPSPTNQPVADVLKPSIVAPGVDIWSAWSPLPTTTLFRGEKWSMISGTSMATPHVAGVAAIVRQAHPEWSPSTIASALATTAIPLDSLDNPLYAYDEEENEYGQVIKEFKRPGNAFDFGSGFVDAATALDPGLIFDATYPDYIKFLCTVKKLDSASVQDATSETCPASPGLSSDLNLPSITVGTLTKSRVVPRTVTNVGPLETYTAIVAAKPADVEVTVDPPTFTIAPGATQLLTFTLKALKNAIYVNQTSFGRVYLTGNLGHRAQVPVTVTYRQV